MQGVESFLQAGQITAVTTSGQGHPIIFHVAMAMRHIFSISASAPMAIRQQALAVQNAIADVMTHYTRAACLSYRTTLYNALVADGERGAAEKLLKTEPL